MEQQSVFTLTASKVLLWQEGRGVGHGVPYNFPGQPRWRRGGQMAAELCVSQLCACLLSRAIDIGLGGNVADFYKTLTTAPAHRCIPKFAKCDFCEVAPITTGLGTHLFSVTTDILIGGN